MEYIRIESSGKFFGERNLLEGQLGLVNSIKRYKEYHKLRRQEMLLKIGLKRNISEALEELSVLNKILPKAKAFDEVVQKDEDYEDFSEAMRKAEEAVGKDWRKTTEVVEDASKERIESELGDIRKRLAAMQ